MSHVPDLIRSDRPVRKRLTIALLAVLTAVGATAIAPPAAGAATGTADLSTSVSHTPSGPMSGEEISLTVTVTNAGPGIADSVVVGLRVGWNLQIRSTSPATARCRHSGDGESITCDAGTVAAGASTSITLVAVTNTSGLFQVPVAASSTTPDPDASNNGASLSLLVRSGPSQIERAVAGIYEQVLGRPASAEEVDYWSHRWEVTGYMERPQLVLGIIAGPESRRLRVRNAYDEILGRAATASDVSYWSARMGQGLTHEALEVALVGSGEFWSQHGPGNSARIDAAYDAILGRPARAQEMSTWIDRGTSIGSLAASLQYSNEGRNRVLAARVDQVFHRAPNNFDRFLWIGAVRAGATADSQWASLYAAYEYLAQFPYTYEYPVEDLPGA